MDSKSDKKLLSNKITIVVLISALLIVLSIVLLVFVMKEEKALLGADQAIRLSSQGGFECEYAEAQKLYPLGEGVLKVTTDRIAYLTLAGNEVFSTSVDYSNPSCLIRDGYAVVLDIDGYAFTLLDANGVIYSKPTTNKIKAATIAHDGMCAIITDSSDSYGEVIIYDPSGVVLSKWSSYNSGYPLACCFNSTSTMLAITTVNTTGAENKPYLRVFSLTENYTGTLVSDYAVYSIEESDIISSVLYVGDELFAFSADAIYQVVNDQLRVIGSDFGSIINATCVGDCVFIIYSDGIEQLNKLAVISASGTTIYNSPIGTDLNTVSTDNSRYAVSIDRRIYIFNRNGDVIADISVDEEILRIGFIGTNKLVVVSITGVHTIDY